MLLSVVHRQSSVVVSSLVKYCRYERNNMVQNVSHMPGLCLRDIGGTPYISYNMMPPKALFHIFFFFSETANKGGTSYFVRIMPKSRPL